MQSISGNFATTLQHFRRPDPCFGTTVQHCRRPDPHSGTTVQHFRHPERPKCCTVGEKWCPEAPRPPDYPKLFEIVRNCLKLMWSGAEHDALESAGWRCEALSENTYQNIIPQIWSPGQDIGLMLPGGLCNRYLLDTTSLNQASYPQKVVHK